VASRSDHRPDWTDATDFAAVIDPAIAPAIIVGERFGLMPEVYTAGNDTDPAVFMNDETRIKVRMFAASWCRTSARCIKRMWLANPLGHGRFIAVPTG